VRRFPLPASSGYANLNTAVFDRRGVLWFTGQSGIYGRLDPRVGKVRVFPAPRGEGPYGITTTPSGAVYYASLAGSHLGRVDVTRSTVRVLQPPTRNQGARRAWSDSKGRIWVSEWNVGKVAVHDPSTGRWREWRLPGATPMPYAVYVDETDDVWLSDFGANALLRFDPNTESFIQHPTPELARERQANPRSPGRGVGRRVRRRQARRRTDALARSQGYPVTRPDTADEAEPDALRECGSGALSIVEAISPRVGASRRFVATCGAGRSTLFSRPALLFSRAARWRFDDRVLLPTRTRKAEAAQRAFELGHTCSDALEVLTGEREKTHRGARHDRGCPLSRQEECDLAERVARAENLGRLATVGQDIGLSLFDEVDRGSVVVQRDDLGTRSDLDLTHRGR
jgi:sugar lactone lactonase YvrE